MVSTSISLFKYFKKLQRNFHQIHLEEIWTDTQSDAEHYYISSKWIWWNNVAVFSEIS